MPTIEPMMPMVSNPPTKPGGHAYTIDDREYWEMAGPQGGVRRYQRFEYPAMLFRGVRGDTGKAAYTTRIVGCEREAAEALAEGWCREPQEALDAYEAAQQAVARAAAEVAHAAQALPERAKREYTRRSADAPGHVTE